VGAGTGAFAAALSLTAASSLGWKLGAIPALPAAAIIGAVGARLGAGAIGRRVVAHLVNLEQERHDHSARSLPQLGLAGFDDAIEAHRETLARADRLKAESEAIERLARTFHAAAAGPETPDGPRPAPSARAGCHGLQERLREFAALLVRNAT